VDGISVGEEEGVRLGLDGVAEGRKLGLLEG
jgi:hypothetical protein